MSKSKHLNHVTAKIPIQENERKGKERKIYFATPPEYHWYEGTKYHFYKKIHDNMFMYESKYGFKICFDNFELHLKEE